MKPQVKVLIIIFPLLLVLAACSKFPKGTPKCVKKMIRKDDNSKSSSYDTVYEYTVEGQKVYKFCPRSTITDGAYVYYDDECNQICIIGGFAGYTMKDCPSLDGKLFENKRLIWAR